MVKANQGFKMDNRYEPRVMYDSKSEGGSSKGERYISKLPCDERGPLLNLIFPEAQQYAEVVQRRSKESGERELVGPSKPRF